MEKTGQIEIRVKGRKGNLELSPDQYDIREIMEVLQNAENLLFPGTKRSRPVISYDIAAGSVRHIFRTTLQAVIGFNAILAQINTEHYSVDFLELPTARAFEFFQQLAQKHDYEYEISTSVAESSSVIINRETRFIRHRPTLLPTE